MFFRGQTIGKYRILSSLGSGGFGTVYLAEDTWIDKKVALKVPHKQNLDFSEMLKEPRLLASMSHPNIVTVLTAEKQDDVFFIVMEYVPGETLEHLIMREGALDLTRALDFSCQICNAVDHAHRAGILHRDLRPGNMLVSETGMLKVTDFGTSRYPRDRRPRDDGHRQPAVHGARAVSRQGRVRERRLLGRRHDVSDADRVAAVRHAGAGRSRAPDARRAGVGAAHQEPEDSEGHQRHRPARAGPRPDGALSARADILNDLLARGRPPPRRAARAGAATADARDATSPTFSPA